MKYLYISFGFHNCWLQRLFLIYSVESRWFTCFENLQAVMSWNWKQMVALKPTATDFGWTCQEIISLDERAECMIFLARVRVGKFSCILTCANYIMLISQLREIPLPWNLVRTTDVLTVSCLWCTHFFTHNSVLTIICDILSNLQFIR